MTISRQKIETERPKESGSIDWDVKLGDETLQIDPQLMQQAALELFNNAFQHERGEGTLVFHARTEGDHFDFELREPKTNFCRPNGKLGERAAAQGRPWPLWSWTSSVCALSLKPIMVSFRLIMISERLVSAHDDHSAFVPGGGVGGSFKCSRVMTTDHRRILIIDDERPILMTLEALLQRHGYTI